LIKSIQKLVWKWTEVQPGLTLPWNIDVNLTSLKIHLDIKSGWDWICLGLNLYLDQKPIGMDVQDGYHISKSNRWHGISIKCEWNWVEIDLRLNWKQFKIAYQLDISNNKIILIQIF
jgi:hypothetical protein